MNKAFVREPDDTLDIRCPQCKVIGTPVSRTTVVANVTAGAADNLSDAASFCANSRCPVAYFDALEQWLPISVLRRSIYPKDPTAPLCYCFGLTAEQVEADARAKRPERIRLLIARAATAEAHCEVLAPNGCSCVAEVQRHYLKCGREAR